MRIIFMGTPEFALPSLGAVLAAGHEVAAVYTKPPRAAGRGLALRKSAVHRFAEAQGLAVLTPERLKPAAEEARFRGLNADAAVVVAYGLVLPKPILDGTRYGAFNLHASLLPRWRGAAPIERAIMAGDAETGVSVMRMEEGLDTGPICLAHRVAVGAEATSGELHEELAKRGAELMVKALAELEQGTLECRPQGVEGVTYAPKIELSETRIDWSRTASEVHNQIRGLSPHPGAWFEAFVNGQCERIRALRSTLVAGAGSPGTLLDDQLTIACGEGSVRLLQLQRAGRRPVTSAEFRRGTKLPIGLVCQ